ncbi:MAG: tetratricopeptide repeat protein [Bacteroidota bacterium]
MSSSENNLSWFDQLWARKVPQYLGSYLAVGFGLLQFLEFIVQRYDLRPQLVDKYLVLWLLSIPAVFLLLYYQGRLPKRDKGRSWQSFFVGSNLGLAILASLFFFNSPQAQASKLVAVTDENGASISAHVPTLEKIKNVAIFQFEDKSETPSDWWSVAFSNLLQLDLRQRPEFYPVAEYTLQSYNDRFGVPSFSVLNVGIQRKIAQRSRNDYFTQVDFTIEDDIYRFQGGFYRTADGEKLFDLQTENTDPFQAINSLSEQIIENIPNPLPKIESQVNLPVEALITNNLVALEALTRSRMTYYRDPTNLDAVIPLAREAVAADPSCAICHFYLGDPLYGNRQVEEAKVELTKSVQYSSSLPEREQFRFKKIMYFVNQDYESYIRLLEAERQLFPYEYDAYSALINYYQQNYGLDSTKQLIQEAIDNGHIERGLLARYNLQYEEKAYAEAEATLDEFFRTFPDRDEDKLRYAGLYEAQGRLEDAKQILEERGTLDPTNIEIMTQLAALEYRQLNFAASEQQLQQALRMSNAVTDSLRVLYEIASNKLRRGQVKAALADYALYEKALLKRQPINQAVISNLGWKLNAYALVGDQAAIKALNAEIGRYAPDFNAFYECYTMAFRIIDEFGQAPTLAEYEKCFPLFEVYGETWKDYYRITTAILRDDYAAAATTIASSEDVQITIVNSEGTRARIFRLAGELKKAENTLQAAIDNKSRDNLVYLEMARLKKDTDPTTAKRMIERLLLILAEADDDHLPTKAVRELARELEM